MVKEGEVYSVEECASFIGYHDSVVRNMGRYSSLNLDLIFKNNVLLEESHLESALKDVLGAIDLYKKNVPESIRQRLLSFDDFEEQEKIKTEFLKDLWEAANVEA